MLWGSGLLLAVLGATAAALGPVAVPLPQLLNILLHPRGSAAPEYLQTIVWQIRLPRVLLAMEVGAALSLAGVTYQGLFRNPLADPYVLGVSSGAALGATLAVVWRHWGGPSGAWVLPALAFAGALFTTAVVYLLGQQGRRLPLTGLLLAGVAVSAMSSALVSALLIFAGQSMQEVVYWMMGSLNGRGWPEVVSILPFLAGGSAILAVSARPLDLFLAGEERAQALGLPVEATKLLLLTSGALLAAAAVATSGVIGFAGLIIPHAARLLVGPAHRRLLPAAALLGAAFLLATDTVARLMVQPVELPIGVITAVCGSPFFLWLLRRQAAR
ncbi:MAG: iron ABC transporter permease [Limnochordaceae bacterium]|nr:iron ABC transporter permease [Limnochordaceae bacterium]